MLTPVLKLTPNFLRLCSIDLPRPVGSVFAEILTQLDFGNFQILTTTWQLQTTDNYLTLVLKRTVLGIRYLFEGSTEKVSSDRELKLVGIGIGICHHWQFQVWILQILFLFLFREIAVEKWTEMNSEYKVIKFECWHHIIMPKKGVLYIVFGSRWGSLELYVICTVHKINVKRYFVTVCMFLYKFAAAL